MTEPPNSPPPGPHLTRPWPLRQAPPPALPAALPPAEPGLIEYERPPKRRGPSWWAKAAHWLLFRDEALPAAALPSFSGETMICPRCDTREPVGANACARCGMPFICVVEPARLGQAEARPKRETWRHLLALATLIFVLTNAVIVSGSNADYEGHTSALLSQLRPVTDNEAEIYGPGSFQTRTELALGLLSGRAPDYYRRIQGAVARIDFLPDRVLKTDSGAILNLEQMGAVSFPAQGRVYVLLDTAFPSGLDEYWDRDVFTYAGVLVHELRHIELYESGQAPGGWQEEVLCEQAAYDALKQAGAPGGVLQRYEQYFDNPQAARYQHWYDWYRQQE